MPINGGRQPLLREPPESSPLNRLGKLRDQAALDLTAHVAAADPHPTYLRQAEGDALYAPLGTTLSGVYTPTLFNVANLDPTPAAFQCQYLRVGSVVSVTGKVSVNPTLTATLTQLGISLPIASNIVAQEDCGGVAFASGIASQGAAIRGDAANDRAEMAWIATDISDQPMYFSFQYRII